MIKRELYMSRIRPFIGTELIKVMTGIRRCGKSVMLELIQQELAESGVSRAQFISINFEDMSYSHLQTAQALHDEITARAAKIEGKVYLFFDEIQEVKDWEKCINSFRVLLDCDIYITGSNAKLLSGELATYLGGRYVEFVIYPFSFGEFMELYRSIMPDASIQQCFQKYLLAGGMPHLANLRYADAPSKQYLHDLFNCICHVSISPIGFSYVITHFSGFAMDIILSKYSDASNRFIIKSYCKCKCIAFIRR